MLSLIYLGFIHFRSIDKKSDVITWKEISQGSDLWPLLKQGSYVGLEKFANSFCFICFVNMFVFYGEEVSTAVSITFSWDQIAFLPIMGMHAAVMSLYSRFLGKGDPKGAILSLHAAVRITFCLMLIFSILFWTLSDTLIAAFLGDKKIGMDYLIIYKHSKFFFKTASLYIFANAAIFLYKAALRSLGYSRWCFYLSLTVHLLLVASCYCGVYIFKISPIGIWGFFMSMLSILAFSFIIKFYLIYLRELKVTPNRLIHAE